MCTVIWTGTTTTPFDMVVLNEMSRFHLALDALKHIPRLRLQAENAIKFFNQELHRHHDYIENPPEGPDDRTIFEHIKKTAPPLRQAVGAAGDLAEGERLAAGGILDMEYLNSYVAHAAMETHSATARFEDGKVTVWASTQAPFQARSAVMSALGLPADKVRIVSRYVGGGFGGKTEADEGVEAGAPGEDCRQARAGVLGAGVMRIELAFSAWEGS